MNKNQKILEKIITTSVGNQYMASYAGSVGDVKYFLCKEVQSGRILGFAAQIDDVRFGPVCRDLMDAVKRARNIANVNVPWWTKVFFARQK